MVLSKIPEVGGSSSGAWVEEKIFKPLEPHRGKVSLFPLERLYYLPNTNYSSSIVTGTFSGAGRLRPEHTAAEMKFNWIPLP